jgi:hypothetical protein
VAVNPVSVILAQLALFPSGTAKASMLQSPAGATGDTTFVIDCRGAKTERKGSLRGCTIQLKNLGTAFASITVPTISLDNAAYATAVVILGATTGAEAALGAITLTTLNVTQWVSGKDFNYMTIVTTVGDATSGFELTIGN